MGLVYFFDKIILQFLKTENELRFVFIIYVYKFKIIFNLKFFKRNLVKFIIEFYFIVKE